MEEDIRKIIAEVCPNAVDGELMEDSFGMIELLAVVESRMGVRIPDEDALGIETVSDLVDVVTKIKELNHD